LYQIYLSEVHEDYESYLTEYLVKWNSDKISSIIRYIYFSPIIRHFNFISEIMQIIPQNNSLNRSSRD